MRATFAEPAAEKLSRSAWAITGSAGGSDKSIHPNARFRLSVGQSDDYGTIECRSGAKPAGRSDATGFGPDTLFAEDALYRYRSRLAELHVPLQDAASDRIEGNPATAVEVLGDKLNLTEAELGSVLRYLIEGGDLSR